MSSTEQNQPAQKKEPAYYRRDTVKEGFFRRLSRRPLSLIGFIFTLFFILLAFIGPLLAPYSYNTIIRGTDIGLESRAALKGEAPGELFPFGTDQRGRDIYSRMLWGVRETLGLPLVATAISLLIGSVIGLLIGFSGGRLDEIVSRILDSLLSIPALVLALVSITTIVPILSDSESAFVQFLGARNISLTLVIVIIYIPIISRVVRSATLSIRHRGYIEQARLRGESCSYILFIEILPGVMPTLVVEASLRLSYAIILVTSLGFLGLGVQPPVAEWGRMVLDGRSRILDEPWELWFPVAGIAILILSLNLLSDGLRRILRKEDQL